MIKSNSAVGAIDKISLNCAPLLSIKATSHKVQDLIDSDNDIAYLPAPTQLTTNSNPTATVNHPMPTEANLFPL